MFRLYKLYSRIEYTKGMLHVAHTLRLSIYNGYPTVLFIFVFPDVLVLRHLILIMGAVVFWEKVLLLDFDYLLDFEQSEATVIKKSFQERVNKSLLIVLFLEERGYK
jgi:hypothetical protein